MARGYRRENGSPKHLGDSHSLITRTLAATTKRTRPNFCRREVLFSGVVISLPRTRMNGAGEGGGVNRASKTAERMITTQMKNGNNYEDEHTKKKQNKEQKK